MNQYSIWLIIKLNKYSNFSKNLFINIASKYRTYFEDIQISAEAKYSGGKC